MIVYMIEDQGRARIAKLVSHEMARQGLTGTELGARGMPSYGTIKRVRAGKEVSDEMLDAIGGRLGMPRDFILYVGIGDVRKIRASGAEPDLIRWSIELIRADRPDIRDQRRGVAG